MTVVAVIFLVLSILIVWGGLAASALMLRRRPEREDYPEGAVDDHRAEDGIIEHDT